MPSNIPLKHLRGRVSHRRNLEHREKVLHAHEQIEDWYLGPRPEGVQHWDIDDWRNPRYCEVDDEQVIRIAVDPAATVLDRLLDHSFRLQSRLRQSLANVPALRPVVETVDASNGPDAKAAVEALETFAVGWAQELWRDPMALLDGLEESPSLLSGLQRLGSLTLNGKRYRELEDEFVPEGSWHLVLALAAATHPMWIRPPETWEGSTPTSLLQHLLADFAVPPVITEWLLNADLSAILDARLSKETRAQALVPLFWWVARASGCSSYRIFGALSLPGCSLSAAQVSAIESVPVASGASPSLSGFLAIGEVFRLGGDLKDWHRLTGFAPGPPGRQDNWRLQELAERITSCYRQFPIPIPQDAALQVDRHRLTPQEWLATVRWLMDHGADLGHEETPWVLSWALAAHRDGQHTGQPPFSWKGRTARSVRAVALAFCERWRSAVEGRSVRWSGKGWNLEWDGTTAGQSWRMQELTSSRELAEEGTAQRHCVGSYAEACVLGSAAIFGVSSFSVQ